MSLGPLAFHWLTVGRSATGPKSTRRRRARLVVEDVFETTAEPIKNPVTGADHRVGIDLPNGFEYSIVEIGSGTTRSRGVIELDKTRSSYAQFARLHLTNDGVVRAAA